MTDSYIITRALTIEELSWLERSIPTGTIVYKSSESNEDVKGFPATFEPDGTGEFFEVPYDAVVKQEGLEETPDSPVANDTD